MQNAPFIRLLCPLITGICIQHFCPAVNLIYIFFITTICSLLFYLIPRNPAEKFRFRYTYGISICFLFCTLGMLSVALKQMQETPIPATYIKAIARIDENNGKKIKSVTCTVTIEHLIDQNEAYHQFSKKAILYFYPDDHACALVPGNYIIFKQKLQPIQNIPNPEAFDYASYTQRKGILYSQYLPEKDWRRLGFSPRMTWKEKALYYRTKVVDIISEINLDKEEQALLNALLLGYADGISTEQRKLFSSSGLSHILAVSGLHTGIIWSILYIAFYPLIWLRMPQMRHIFTIVGLWIYAFITGLSPSVIRACIMATFIIIGYVLNRKGNTLNSLCAAAFFMLLYQPYYLFDIGFQLSYISVLSIVLFYPVIFHGIMTNNKLWNKIAGIIAISLATQIGTLPVAAYYFHTVPLLFLFTNLLIIPLLPIILGISIISVTLAAIDISIPWIHYATEHLLHFLSLVAYYTGKIPCNSLKIWLEPRHIVLYFGILSSLYIAFKQKKSNWIIFCLSFILLFLIYNKAIPLPKQIENGWVIYNDNQNTVINFIDDKNNFLYSTDSIVDYPKIEKIASNFWIKNGINKFLIAKDSMNNGNLFISRPFILLRQKRILLLDSTNWKTKNSAYQLPIDYVIVTNDFKGRLSDLLPLFKIKHLIIPSNITYFKSYWLERECSKHHINCYVIRKEGAWASLDKNEPCP